MVCVIAPYVGLTWDQAHAASINFLLSRRTKIGPLISSHLSRQNFIYQAEQK